MPSAHVAAAGSVEHNVLSPYVGYKNNRLTLFIDRISVFSSRLGSARITKKCYRKSTSILREKEITREFPTSLL